MKLKKSIPIITIMTYIIMVTINALANILPINDISTGEVSDKYANLFAPAPITFSIWGLIYLLLLFYCLYQFKYYKSKDNLFIKIGVVFSLSSLVNACWILAWHYDQILVTVILMVMLLCSLIIINLFIRKQVNGALDKFFIKLPFSVYFGWITVATIANITTYLVSIQWDGFGISPVLWTNTIILVGAVIGAITTIVMKNVPYALVIVWAYVGICNQHIREGGFDGDYISVIITTVVAIVLVVLSLLYVIYNAMQKESPTDDVEIYY